MKLLWVVWVGAVDGMVDVGIHCAFVGVSMVPCLLHLRVSLVECHLLEWRLIRVGVDSQRSLVGDGLMLVWVCLHTLSWLDPGPVGCLWHIGCGHHCNGDHDALQMGVAVERSSVQDVALGVSVP